MSAKLDKKIDNWRKKLLDLSKRNRLINFKPTKTKSLPLKGSKVSSIENLGANQKLYIRKSEKDIEEENDEGEIVEKTVDVMLSDVRGNELLPSRDRENTKNSLNNLRVFKNRFSRERGVETFYLAVSFLEWYESSDSDEKINSPLILLPVDIEEEIIRKKERHNYKITYRGEDPIVNPALKKKLEDDFGFTISDEEPRKDNLNDFISEIDDKVSGGFDKWSVKKKLVLGIFDFQKVSLYRDLEENRDEIKINGIVKALNDDYSDLDTSRDVPDQDDLDEEIDPEETYQVVDADPSQQVAIEAAKSGKSFVLEGPPGTGKSQTITNIISEKIANGEKVLFVSEKKAALEVVKENLEEVGLGCFCLDVHSGNKKKVLEQIDEEMTRSSGKKPDGEQDLKKLKLRQEKLNKYGEIINKKFGKVEKTPYEAIGKIAKRKEAPDISLELEDIFIVDEKQVENIKDDLRHLKDYKYEIQNFDSHTWKKSVLKSWGLKTGKKMEESLEGQKEMILEITEFAENLEISVDSMQDMRNLLDFLKLINDCPAELEEDLISVALIERKENVSRLESREIEKDEKLEELEKKYEEIPEIDPEDYIDFMEGKAWAVEKEEFSDLRELEEERENLLSRLENNYRQIPDLDAEDILEVIEGKNWLMRKVSSEFKEKREKVLEFAKEDYNPDQEDLVEDLEILEELEEVNKEISEFKEFKKLLGEAYNDRNTEWGKLRKELDRYWNLRENLTSHKRENYEPNHEQIIDDLEELKDIEELEEDISDLQETRNLLGSLYDDRETDWELVKSFLEWLEKYLSYEEFRDNRLDREVETNPTKFEDLEKDLDNLISRFDDEMAFFKNSMKYSELNLESKEFSSHLDTLDQFIEDLDELKDWTEFSRRLEELKESPAEEFTLKFIKKGENVNQIADSFLNSFYMDFLDQIFKQTDLDQFSSKEMDQVMDDFRNLDKKQEEIAQKEVIAKVTDKRPNYQRHVGSSGGIAYLKREINKESKHKALRKTFSRASEVITSLKPCFMMSPLTVAKNIQKGSIEFDTVIFDEASQIEPETAVSSLIRADQAIIVGDTKQLPPTKFFDAEVEDDEDVREDLESILDETSSALPKEKLLWHYRSKDNELIEFSNRYYYQNRLKTFPGNDNDLETGVEFEYVEDGVYDRGESSKNRKEAKRVADLIEKHVEEKPEKSLGVVAFSSKQREAIREELHIRKEQNRELRKFTSGEGLEQFFVKSLENVQGDERKKMIFSVGYGPDKNGEIHKFFGPLSKKGGERRLNVAITRAEEKVIVVSSMQPENLDVSNTSNKGPKHFKKYLKYAKHGDEVLKRNVKTSEQKDFDSEFEEAVYDRLTEEGLDVTTQVESSGYSIDLAVKHPNMPGKYILGIECDGAAYHSTKTARERDRLRQSVLEDLGWKIHRIWSTDWIRNEEKEIEKIVSEINAIREGGKTE